MKSIAVKKITDQSVSVPGSKSLSHRMLICAALAHGDSTLHNCLDSEDVRLTRKALTAMGVTIRASGDTLRIGGRGGSFTPVEAPLYLANSGTSMRLLAGVAALGRGTYIFTGSPRMQKRPIQPLLDALRKIGIDCGSIHDNGCPPIRVTGGATKEKNTHIDCSSSSQYLSALLLMAPCTEKGMAIQVSKGPVSHPYVDLSVDVMNRFGATLTRQGYQWFDVPGGQRYQGGDYTVEPDCSQASYFWAAGAISDAGVTVDHIPADTRQGDARFVEVLARMGCRVHRSGNAVTVHGGSLRGVDVDMAAMPDLVPTLAVTAAFAEGKTVIRNVAHLKIKESDRLSAVSAGLRRMGIEVKKTEQCLIVEGGAPVGASIDTHDDHRIAMSFAVAGLKVPGMRIENERCVEKSFPDFWRVFEALKGN